jgi:hypothetical protein
MLAGMGFHIAFCPYDTGEMIFDYRARPNRKSLSECRNGGTAMLCRRAGKQSSGLVDAIAKAAPGRQTEGYIPAGDWVRFYPDQASWRGIVQTRWSSRSLILKQACVGGGFI